MVCFHVPFLTGFQTNTVRVYWFFRQVGRFASRTVLIDPNAPAASFGVWPVMMVSPP